MNFDFPKGQEITAVLRLLPGINRHIDNQSYVTSTFSPLWLLRRIGGTMVLCAVLLLLPTRQGMAQYLPDYAVRALDSALGGIRMTRADLFMRWDAVANDPHRLSAIKRLFGDPLATFSLSDSIASSALAAENGYRDFINYLGIQLDLGKDALFRNRAPGTDQEIMLYSKINMNSLSFTHALLLRRFLALAIATDARLVNVRGDIQAQRLERLVDYADSLIIQSEGSADASLVELKMAERYGLARGKQFFNEDAKDLDYAGLLEPGVTLFTTALEFARMMSGQLHTFRDSVQTQIWETPLGLVAIGGPGDDIYSGDFFCIVDIGGNDIYRPTRRTKQEAYKKNVQLIVDFNGDDTYIGGDFSLGGTIFGASTLIDMNGNDSYSAGNFALGAGLFGTGILFDSSGSDRYAGGTAVQGAGIFGLGLLIDAGGNDHYMAHYAAQAFAGVRGVGMIVEHGGNDSYIAASPYADFLRYDDHYETFTQGASLGARPIASGGIGLIAEGSGNDIYVSDIYGQGTAYWFALGAIVDKQGNDSYTSYQYAQGSGVHLAFGVLIDESGHDNYVSHGVSQGCGHDIAFGGLYDAKGDDNYVVESLSLGGGNANAISLFVDGGGEDGYVARRTNTLGFSDLRRDYSMIGIFLDLEKKDFYGTIRGGNDSLWTGSYYGAGLDGEFRPESESEPGPSGSAIPKKTPEEIEAELATDIPTLFILASAAPQKYQYIVEPARNRLVERYDESLPYLLEQLNSESSRERLALNVILPRMGKRVTPILVDTVLRGQINRRGAAIMALGDLKDTTATIALGQSLLDTSLSWRLRSSAAEALLKMPSQAARPYLRQALLDENENIRGYAARALTMIADSADFELLADLLSDRNQIVRHQVYLALERRRVDSLPMPYARALAGNRTGTAHELLYALAPTLTDPASRQFLIAAMLNDSLAAIRARGVRLALEWKDEALLYDAWKLKGQERNSQVLFELNKIPEFDKKAVKRIEKERADARRKGVKAKTKNDSDDDTADNGKNSKKASSKKKDDDKKRTSR